MYVLETKNLTKYYGRSRGVIDLNLSLSEGEIFGFIGPNGAGKTTTIRLLLNFIFPTRGSAKIFGMDCVKESREIKKLIGYLPGEVAYYGEFCVRQILDYSASFYPGRCFQRARELAEYLDLDLETRVENLSAGNKKKVGIVQALLHSPRLLILDEPTSGLDPLIQRRFFELLKQENERGATIFFSSHVLSEVQKLCHRVGIIKEGRLLKVDDIDAIRRQQVKKVAVSFKDMSRAFDLALPGVKDLVRDNGTYRFLFDGDVSLLVRVLATKDVEDLWIEEPTLEEVFIHYYQAEGQQ